MRETDPVSVTLRGIQPDSLAGYLAGLGLARVCAEQLRGDIRAAWREEGFTLWGLDSAELLEFLSAEYAPSPIVSPWAGGSGFAEGENRSALKAILESSTPRLATYREVISKVLQFPELPPTGLTIADVLDWARTQIATLPENKTRTELVRLLCESEKSIQSGRTTSRTPVADLVQGAPAAKLFTRFKSERRRLSKAGIAARCRNELPDACVAWLDASLVVFPNEGGEIDQIPTPFSKDAVKPRLEYSRLFMECIGATLLANEPQPELLRGFLHGTPTRSLRESAAGMFMLGSAGGANTGPGVENEKLPNNPWQFIFLIEGSLLWAGSLSSQQSGMSSVGRFATSPFTVRHVAAGNSSFDGARDQAGVVEVWTPVWSRPSSVREIERLLADGRVEVRARSGSMERARDALDFADAVGSLGVDRGVESFLRFALLDRRGGSYIAVPAGRLQVRHRSEVDLLRQLDAQLDVLDSQFIRRFKGDGPPANLRSLRSNVNEARFDVATRGGSDAMVRLVRAVGALERVLARRDPSKDPRLPRPLGGLGLEWIAACGDTPEVRLAAALTSLGRTGGAGGFRSYVSSVSPQKEWEFLPAPRSRSWFGSTLPARLASVLSRRLLDVNAPGKEAAGGRNPTWGARQVGIEDIAVFLEPGLIDEVALEELLFGFTWVKQGPGPKPRIGGPAAPPAPREYALLKLLCLPDGVPVGTERVTLKTPPELVPLLIAGRVDDAVRVASAALRARGLKPRRLSPSHRTDAEFGTRLAAALLFPMFQVDALLRDALLPSTEEHHLTQEMTDAV